MLLKFFEAENGGEHDAAEKRELSDGNKCELIK